MMRTVLKTGLFWKRFSYLVLSGLLLTCFAVWADAKSEVKKNPQSTNLPSPVLQDKKMDSAKIVVIGDKNTKRYHLPGMPSYYEVEKQRRVFFASEQEAMNNGYQKVGTGGGVVLSADRRGLIVGNSDSRRYHLPGMPFYNKVAQSHRVYFASETEAIKNGYYKAGTGRDAVALRERQNQKYLKQSTPQDLELANIMKNQYLIKETAASLPYKEEKTQKSAASGETPKAASTPPPGAPVPEAARDLSLAQKQKNNAAVAQEGVFLKREGGALQLETMDINRERPRRLEASYSFDYLKPNNLYGDWHSGQFAFYHTLSPELTYFLIGAFFNRQEGNGASGTVGAYKSWTSFLYTCTSVSAGTHSTFLPEFRIDHDFNFSVWPEKRINFLAGVSYIDYFDDHSGVIFSGGPMAAYKKFDFHYRLFYNLNNPGSISSFSHLVRFGYGEEGWQRTYLNLSFGKQAYLATYVTPQEVQQNSLSLNLQHRHWLGKFYGVFGDIGFSKLEDGYDKYSLGMGAFYAF